MEKLVKFTRFIDYISAWPQQSAQMRAITLLMTDMEKGPNYVPTNTSYLNTEFFSKYPTSAISDA